MKKKYLASFALLCILFSCKKSDDCSLSAANLVGEYQLTAVTENGADVFNDSNYYAACSRDNIYALKSDGSWTVTEGAVLCSTPTSLSGVWSFASDTLNAFQESFRVTDFNCSGFKLNFTIVDPNPANNIVVIQTFVRK
jgi:hypothetical protein